MSLLDAPTGPAARAPQGPLENRANNSSPQGPQRVSRRESRYARRGLVWDVTGLPRVGKCGRTRWSKQGVAVRCSGAGVGYAGVVTCGSVWVCPVCNAKIMQRRALEIGVGVARWQAQGGAVAFGTLTMRHRKGQPLNNLWSALSAAWGRVTSGKGWVTDQERYGIVGWLRVVEVTWGENGWHVHVHCLLFLDRRAVDLPALHSSIFGRWARKLVALGLSAPLMQGQDLRLLTGPADRSLAAYFTKAQDHGHRIGLEVTASQSKTARHAHSTSTPWHLLDLIEQGDADALDLWREWERGSHGRRQLTWSKGLRDRLSLLAEQTDEEVAAQELGTRDDTLVVITPEGWDVLCRTPRLLGRLLDVTYAGGLAALRPFLDAHDVTYALPDALRSAA